MSEKPKRFHRYKPESNQLIVDRFMERLSHHAEFVPWRKRIDARKPGSIAFAPEAK